MPGQVLSPRKEGSRANSPHPARDRVDLSGRYITTLPPIPTHCQALSVTLLRHHLSMSKSAHKHQQKAKTVLTGRLNLNTRGKGFFTPEDADPDFKAIEIPAECTGVGLNGDTVKVELGPRKKHFPQTAEVIEVLERRTSRYVGTVTKIDGTWFLDPDNRNMLVDILLTGENKQLKPDYKALVEFTDWTDKRKPPTGKLIEVIGKRGEHETEMRSAVIAQGFDYDYPAAVEREAESIGESKATILAREIETRRDLRDVITFTIDPFDAKDFDDAISVHPMPGGHVEIGIHIADVSAYVTEDDAIDLEAQKRGTSIYLVDRTIPMLPEILSNDVCSLNPDEDKLAFSAVFTFDENHQIIDQWFGETVIRSNKRFTYEDAQEALDAEAGPHIHELMLARDIARTIRRERFAEGAIAFETDEIKFELDANNVPIAVHRKVRQETNLMIEDLMLLANKRVAQSATEDCKVRGGPCTFVYRIHDEPNPDKIIDLATFLEAMGFELKHQHGAVTPSALNALFKQVEGTPAQDIVEMTAIRSMAKAIYSLKNVGHFGLAFKHYCHFTSPIRRYPDLMVHRILKQILSGKGTPGRAYAHYEALAKQSTEREIAAAEAERDSIKYKQVEYMSQHIGETFDGVISGVTDFGIFVEELETKAEGLVRLRDLPSDYYNLDKGGLRLVGERTGHKINLCDKVKIKLLAVDLEQKMIDWKIVSK